MSLIPRDPVDSNLFAFLGSLGGKRDTKKCFYLDRITHQEFRSQTEMHSYVGVKKCEPLSRYFSERDAHEALLEAVACMRTVEAIGSGRSYYTAIRRHFFLSE